ncbi:holin [Streptomyces syringium]|uniref:holin n=1 Tax=Streptomyces syringium TaxID=76729 RepID=UPI003D8B9E27
MRKLIADIAERTLAAYVTTFLGLLLADGFDLTDISALKAAAIASIPAALSVIKGAIGAVSATGPAPPGCRPATGHPADADTRQTADA